MYDLTQFSLKDVTSIGNALRNLGKEANSLEEVAQRCVQYLYTHLIDPSTNESACVLARLFKTHDYGQLPSELQTHARDLLAYTGKLPAQVKCLTLLATAGSQPEWNNRKFSQGHQAVPLTSETAVAQIPMIAQLIRGFGLDINTVLAPNPKLLTELECKTYNIFYIPNALGSEFIPAQSQFVEPFGVKSVLGFGGLLPSGDLFAVILFTKVVIPEATASLFKTLPLSIKMALLPFTKDSLFNSLQAI